MSDDFIAEMSDNERAPQSRPGQIEMGSPDSTTIVPPADEAGAAPHPAVPDSGRSPRRERELAILECVAQGLVLFRGDDGKPYAQPPDLGGLCIPCKGLGEWLRKKVFDSGNKQVARATLDDFISDLSARAQFGSCERKVYLRFGREADDIWVDLAGTGFVRVTPSGWSRHDTAPCPFLRPSHMKPLPPPEPGGSVHWLKHFVNVATDEDFALMVAWLIGAMHPEGPYPILVLQGGQGCAKSTTAEVLQRLIDDSYAVLRSFPPTAWDLAVTAKQHWVNSFDNLSHLTPEISNDLCRAATGGAMVTRRLYTDDQEVAHHVCVPIILNGIDRLIEKGDLASRSINIELPVISDTERRPLKSLMEEFERLRPRIFGALLDALSASLANYDEGRFETLPRMADFAARVSACEGELGWDEGYLVELLNENFAHAEFATLESDATASALMEFMSAQSREVIGTATQWLGWLANVWQHDKRALPSNPQQLSSRLNSLAPALRQLGLDVGHRRTSDKRRERLIYVREIDDQHDFIDDADTDADELDTPIDTSWVAC